MVQGGKAEGGGCSCGCVPVEWLSMLQYCGCVCPATASSHMRATADPSYSAVVDIYCNSCAYSAPQLPPAIIAAIVICVLLADLVHSCFFVRKNGIKIASSKAWILACVMLGPLVWPMWWCRQRTLRGENANTPVASSGWSESEPRSRGPVPLPPEPCAPSLEYSPRLNHNVLSDSQMILEVLASAPPADDEVYVAVAQPASPYAGRAR